MGTGGPQQPLILTKEERDRLESLAHRANEDTQLEDYMGVSLEKWRKLPTGLTSHFRLFHVAYDSLPTVCRRARRERTVAHRDEAVEAPRVA